MESVVQTTVAGRLYTFRVDTCATVDFWRIESEGRVWPTPIKVTGKEPEGFFRRIAESADLCTKK